MTYVSYHWFPDLNQKSAVINITDIPSTPINKERGPLYAFPCESPYYWLNAYFLIEKNISI